MVVEDWAHRPAARHLLGHGIAVEETGTPYPEHLDHVARIEVRLTPVIAGQELVVGLGVGPDPPSRNGPPILHIRFKRVRKLVAQRRRACELKLDVPVSSYQSIEVHCRIEGTLAGENLRRVFVIEVVLERQVTACAAGVSQRCHPGVPQVVLSL